MLDYLRRISFGWYSLTKTKPTKKKKKGSSAISDTQTCIERSFITRELAQILAKVAYQPP